MYIMPPQVANSLPIQVPIAIRFSAQGMIEPWTSSTEWTKS